MKRAASILLIILFLFNVGGYYIVFMGFRHHANQVLNARLDAGQYSTEETIELKIPVTLPYPLQQQGFQRVDGKFEHEGQFYKLVKQKIDNDTLYIICIRNVEEKNLVNAFKKFVTLTIDVPSTSRNASTLLAKFLTEFETNAENPVVSVQGWASSISFPVGDPNVISRSHPVLSPPPKV